MEIKTDEVTVTPTCSVLRRWNEVYIRWLWERDPTSKSASTNLEYQHLHTKSHPYTTLWLPQQHTTDTMTQWKFESTGDEVVAAFKEKVQGKTSMCSYPPLKIAINNPQSLSLDPVQAALVPKQPSHLPKHPRLYSY